MNKWIKILIFLIIIIFIGLILKKLVKSDYKNEENGNNKNIQEIEKYILNIDSYKAQISVTVTSNKNVDFYELIQEVRQNQMIKQKVVSPEELAGMEMLYQNGTLQITNSKYNLSKIYNDYPYVSDNQLFLTSFLEGYINSKEKQIQEKDNQIEMSYKSEKNKYNNTQKLYINKSTLKPENLQILDVNKECKVNILYKEIEFNI